jgi:hypothetical protein
MIAVLDPDSLSEEDEDAEQDRGVVVEEVKEESDEDAYEDAESPSRSSSSRT